MNRESRVALAGRSWYLRDIIIGTLVAWALFGSAAYLCIQFVRYTATPPTAESISAYEARFEALRPYLASQSVVGYVSADEIHWPAWGNRPAMRRYFLTQYALAPVIVSYDAQAEWYVANFESQAALATWLSTSDMRVVKYAGNGVALLERGKP